MNRCLCVFSRILGWRVFGRYVDEQLATNEFGMDFEYLDYDTRVFQYRVPWYRSLSDTAAARYRLKRLITDNSIAAGDFDSYIFQGHELAVPFRRFFRGSVRIIADSTPSIAERRERRERREQREQRERSNWTPVRAIRRLWRGWLDWRVFRPMFSQVTSFLVLSDLVRTSLVNDYGVEESKIFTVGPPIYDRVVSLGRRDKPARPVLLFVGNDFERKGGVFLLDLYRRFFSETTDLWIVSSGLDKTGLESSIRVFANIPNTEVLELMLECHVFLFPSHHDELGLVLAEAACAGLPIVARESGGQSEYVRNGENGYLLSPGDGVERWRDAIDSILLDDATRERFSAKSRSIGQRLCTQARFDEQFSKFMADPVA